MLLRPSPATCPCSQRDWSAPNRSVPLVHPARPPTDLQRRTDLKTHKPPLETSPTIRRKQFHYLSSPRPISLGPEIPQMSQVPPLSFPLLNLRLLKPGVKAIQDFVGIIRAVRKEAFFTHLVSEIAELFGQVDQLFDSSKVLFQSLQILKGCTKVITADFPYRLGF